MRDVSIKLVLTAAVAIIAASSFPLTAQQAASATQQATSAGAGGMQVSEVSKADASSAVQLQPVSGELLGKLDAKTAKVGDSVVVKTQAKVKTTDGTEIPKGTKLVGKVIEVQAHSAASQDSRVAIAFDHAELKGGQSVAIHSVIESIQPPVDLAAGSADSSGGFGSPSAGARGSGGGSGPGGMVRGTVGGGANTTTGEASGVASRLGSTADTAVGGVAHDTMASAGDATAFAGSTVQTGGAGSGKVVAHATGVDGVYLATDASGSASGTRFASKKNLRLEDGTRIELGIAVSASH